VKAVALSPAASTLTHFLFAGTQTAGVIMKRFLPPLTAVFVISPAFAQDSTSTDSALPPVVVSATRLPETPGVASSHIQIIDAEEIRRSGARNLTALLRQVAVIQLTDTTGEGSSAGIGMRGFGENGSQNSLLLLNGRRLNNDTDIAPPDLRNLGIEDIDHIEIINGSAGALFGSGAIGGIINIVTKPIRREVRAGYSGGSYDYESYRVRAGERGGEMGMQVMAEKTSTDNYRDRNELNRGFVQGRVTFDEERYGFFVEASRQNLEQNLAGSLLPAQVAQNRRQAQYPGDFTHSQNHRYSAGTHVELNPDWLLTIDGNVRQDESVGVLSNRFIVQSRDQHSVNPRLNGTLKWQGNTVKTVGGYDYDSADYHFLSPFGPVDNRQKVHSHYLQLGWSTSNTWELVTAGRHAEFESRLRDGFTYPAGKDIEDRVDVGSLAFYWRPQQGFSSWLRADENFRFAAGDEQTYRPFLISGNYIPLETQTGISYEAGVELRQSGWRTSLQLYRLELEKEISFDPLLGANVNLDDTRRTGGSLQLDLRIADRFLIGAQVAYVDAEFTSGNADGMRIPFVARDTETLNLTWLAPWRLDVTLEHQRTGTRFPSGDYTNSQPRLKPVHLSNLATTWRWKGLETALRVNNLFDKEYNTYSTLTFVPIFGTAHIPAPERNLVVSVDYRFP
jgi:iron complex outermembrane receptor protein